MYWQFCETEEEILALMVARSLDIDKCQFTIVTPWQALNL